MSRAIAGTNQWQEPIGSKIAAAATYLYPIYDADAEMWGWTRRPGRASGRVLFDEDSELLGVDDSSTVGGSRMLKLGRDRIVALLPE